MKKLGQAEIALIGKCYYVYIYNIGCENAGKSLLLRRLKHLNSAQIDYETMPTVIHQIYTYYIFIYIISMELT